MEVPREHPFAPLRWLFYVAVATWIAFLLWAQPYSRVRVEIAAAITAGAFALLRTAEPLFGRIPRQLRRAADIAVFNVCLTLVLGELGLRALSYFRPSPIFSRVGSTPMERLEEQRQKPGTLRFNFPCNESGEYDQEFRPRREGEHLAITIGDSFSYGVVPHDYHFTSVCERVLGIPVYNMGVPSIGPPEYAYLLQHEALDLKPEVVVIDIFVGNDLVFLYETTPTLDPFLRSWLDRRNALLWLVPERMTRIARENNLRTSDQGPLGSAQGELAGASDAPGATLAEQCPWLADPLQEVGPFSERLFPQVEAQRALGVCREESPSLRVFFDFMLQMKRTAGSTPLAVMLIPDEFQVEDAVWQAVLENADENKLDRDRPQELLVPWFEKNGIPCLDLLPLLRDTPPLADGRKHVYHLRDTHFNARGNRVAGEALAEFLRRNWAQVCSK
jgi:hypothetical protein